MDKQLQIDIDNEDKRYYAEIKRLADAYYDAEDALNAKMRALKEKYCLDLTVVHEKHAEIIKKLKVDRNHKAFEEGKRGI